MLILALFQQRQTTNKPPKRPTSSPTTAPHELSPNHTVHDESSPIKNDTGSVQSIEAAYTSSKLDKMADHWLESRSNFGRQYDEQCVRELIHQRGLVAPYLEAGCHIASKLNLFDASQEASCGELSYSFSSVPEDHMFKEYTSKKGDETRHWYYRPNPGYSCEKSPLNP